MRPDHEFVELVWENGQPVLQGQTSTRSKPASPVSEFSDLSKTQINVNVVSPLKPSIAGKNDILVPVLHNMEAATLPPVNADSINEDEVVSWLHYPLDDALERDCCSDFLGEIPNTNINMLKDSLGVQRYSLPVEEAANDQVFRESSASDSKSSVPHTEGARSMANVASMACTANTAQKPTTKAVGAHVGMLLNAGRALGSIREPHAESSAEDCTTTRLLVSEPYRNLLPCIKSKCMTTAQVALPSLTTLPPKMQPTSADHIKPLQIGGTGFRNFSLFSRPAVTTKANLQCIGNASGQSTTKLCNDFDKNGNSSEEYSLLESAASGASAIGFNICGDGQGEDSGQCTVLRSQSCCQSHQSPLLRKTSDPAKCLDTATDSNNAKSAAQESCQNSNVTENLDLGATENCGDPRYVPEPLVTSSSEGSGNSAGGTGKEAADSTKRKSIYVEEFECQSEDVEDESLDAKKLVPSCVIKSKRSRAAEVHNQSERRRRDRINEKMRALQDLIPNCNKSDKASMLDEAIEYLKALQLQVQIMSGGGMGILPMALPVGMRHLQVPHMMQLSPMGLGSGMGFGLGMHCSAFSGSAISGTGGLHVFGIPQSRFPMPGLPGSGLPMCGLSALPASGVTSSTIGASAHPGRVQPGLVPTLPPNFAVLQDQIQNASSSDYYKLCLGWQQMQVSPEAMNANMYNMLMFQQHQYLAGMSGGKTCNPSTGSGQTTSGTS